MLAGQKKSGSYKPGSVPLPCVLWTVHKAMTISLDKSLPTASSDLPGIQPARAAPDPLSRVESCFVLHRMRLPCHSCHQKCGELLPRHFTLTCIAAGGILSAALSVAFPRLDVIQHPALRCPDFPPAGFIPPAVIRYPFVRNIEKFFLGSMLYLLRNLHGTLNPSA